MGILDKIFGKIFPAKQAQIDAGEAAAAELTKPTPVTPPASTAPATAVATPAAISQVDVEAILDDLAKKNPEKLNWKTSIVDLMKLLGLDSSLAERKELAKELGYTGDMGDSASMNIWLHRQVMNKVAANGGKVPADLKD